MMKALWILGIVLVASIPGNAQALPAGVTFLEPRTFGAGGAQSIAVADFNGDGAMDVVTVSSSVTLYLGDGHGSFTAQPALGIGGTAIVTADFNLDGKPDIAIASTSGLAILLGKGDGTFLAPGFVTGSFSTVTVGDFNGDGRPDIATGATNAQVLVLLGTSGGSFHAEPLFTLPMGNALAMVAADLNGDGKVDLAVTGISNSGTGVTVFPGQGNGTFAAAVPYPVPNAVSVAGLITGDFNGDGLPDLAFTETDSYSYVVQFLLSQSHGALAFGRTAALRELPTDLRTADLNGDGIPDLVVAGSDLAVVLVGEGGAAFHSIGAYVLGPASAIAIADFNGDGVLDVIAGLGYDLLDDNPPGLALAIGAGGGALRSSRALAFGANPSGWAVADFNGDGKLDLAVSEDRQLDPVISILHGDGKGNFGRPVNYPANDPETLVVGDINRDGKPDIAFIGYNSVGTLPGNGDGTFGIPIYSPCIDCHGELMIADFNNDGIPDLMTIQLGDEAAYLVELLGNGDGTFQAPIVIPISGEVTTFAVADFAHRGILDVVASTSYGTYSTYFLTGNGDGTFAPAVILSNEWILGVVADFNQDGNADIALDSVVYLGRGDGTFIPVELSGAAGDFYLTADFNGDGFLDLFGEDLSSGQGFLMLGKGNGSFVRQQREFASGSACAAGDFNGDGKVDLACSTFESPIWILQNTTPAP